MKNRLYTAFWGSLVLSGVWNSAGNSAMSWIWFAVGMFALVSSWFTED